METQKRLFTVDNVWEWQREPGNPDKNFELIYGELIEMSPANMLHSWLASEISGILRDFARTRHLGSVFVEGGFFPDHDRSTLLVPDVAFVSLSRLSPPFTQVFIGFMPDLAIEIKSPSNSLAELREKAALYLSNGSRLVWLVMPDQQGVEVCRAAADNSIQIEFLSVDGLLSGEDVLPGFTLELRELFPAEAPR